MSQTLLVGSLEFAKCQRLDKKPLIWVKLKVLVEADGKTLWKDSFTGINDIKSTLQSNDIKYHDVIKVSDGVYVARVHPSSLNEFNEWTLDTEELSVRSFLTIIDGETGADMFDKDSLWTENTLESQSIDQWFNILKDIQCRG
jgi:hypothetical protein